MIRLKPINLLYAVLFLFFTGCNQANAQTARQPESNPLKINAETTEHPEREEMESLLKELSLKNPFSPKHFSEVTAGTNNEIELEGIMWDNEKPFAVIDGTVVAEGDFIDGKKVIKISNEFVVLDNHGQEEILKIKLKVQ